MDVQADGSWDVSAPLYRDDVESFPDLAEEVIREYGYDQMCIRDRGESAEECPAKNSR